MRAFKFDTRISKDGTIQIPYTHGNSGYNEMPDFEDTIQPFSAKSNSIDLVITRNGADFASTGAYARSRNTSASTVNTLFPKMPASTFWHGPTLASA